MDDEARNSPELTTLERAVLVAALGSGTKHAVTLNAQVNEVKAVVRTPSGVGFVTKLEVPEKFVCLGIKIIKITQQKLKILLFHKFLTMLRKPNF